MKNIFRILCTAAVVMAAAVSCSTKEEYQPAEAPTGPQVYFLNTNSTSYSLPTTATSFSVKLGRANTSDAYTATISSVVPCDEDGIPYFDVPSTVSFAAGQSVVDIPVTFSTDVLGYDNTQSVTLTLNDVSSTTPYGLSELTVSAVVPSPWTSLGTATFVENWWFGDSYKFEILQNDLDHNLYRLVSPFGGGDKPELRVLQPGDTYQGVTVTGTDLVCYDDIFVEYYSYYDDDLYMVFPGRFSSLRSEDKWQYNRVEEYQANGLPGKVQLAPYHYMFNVGGWNHTQADGYAYILFPGYELKDYESVVLYAGKYTDADDVQGVMADVALGADVEKAVLAVVEGNDPSDAIDAISAGTFEGTTLEVTADGVYQVPFDGTPEDGTYSLVLVVFAGDEAQGSDYATFKYAGASTSEEWKCVGTGDYHYGKYFWGEGDDEGLELYQSQTNKSRYKITHWGQDVDFLFTVDPLTSKVTVDADQYVGYTGSYGPVYVADASHFDAEYYEGEYTPVGGTYDASTGLFTFDVVYYVSAGFYGAGFETFTITGGAPSTDAAARVASRNPYQIDLAGKNMHRYHGPLTKENIER